ncbi:MAG: diaminopimelate epimerase, partial [Pseudomonadota bacterium]
EVEACGNAARCVASLVIDERKSPITIESVVGLLPAEKADQNRYSVDMGPVGTDWQSIPLAGPQDTLHMDLTLGPLSDPVAVSVGNPHAVFFVPDSEAVPLADLGPALEHHALFPERANISVATVVGTNRLRQRVWERGVGITRACGTGACAAAAAANRRGLTGREVEIALDGGILEIFWHENGHVIMTGPVATAFSGEIHL